jgi:hypothetical protein
MSDEDERSLTPRRQSSQQFILQQSTAERGTNNLGAGGTLGGPLGVASGNSYAFSSSSSAAENKSLLIDHSNSLPQSQLHEHIDSFYNYTKYNIPPPENLIAKSVFISEPIRSGAPFSFV